jgi:hypothetical protein
MGTYGYSPWVSGIRRPPVGKKASELAGYFEAVSFYPFAQLIMLESIQADASRQLAQVVSRVCAENGWQDSQQAWFDWLSPKFLSLDGEWQDSGTELLRSLQGSALKHTDAESERLLLQAAHEGVDDDEADEAVQALGQNTPIRNWERLAYRLLNDGLVDGYPKNRNDQDHFSPHLGSITDLGRKRLEELTAVRTDQDRLFYSWQSDDRNRTIKIRAMLQQACSELGIEYDEATRGEAGSPEIHATVRTKIASCGIFVADVVIVTGQHDGSRKSPNPNVMYELGLADARLPPERVLLMFDGDTNELPFDVRQRRVSPLGKADVRAWLKVMLENQVA